MNRIWLNTAKQLTPSLSKTKIDLALKGKALKIGEPFVLDLGDHYTGKITLDLSYRGSPVDAPVLLRVKCCEHPSEIKEDAREYHGWVSKSWIQEEYLHLDSLPTSLKLERRYALRYLVLEVIASSSRYEVLLDGCHILATSSAKGSIAPVGRDEREKRIDAIALRTLHECMQTEFEDGPKRDRRLWLGDLRLQALTSYYTYRNDDLVRRCLYLFAGTAKSDGTLASNVFTKPKVQPDDASMFDYSLFFVSTLHDYYQHTKDKKTLEELLPLAERQIALAAKRFRHDVIEDSDVLGWCFLDWNLALNKQCGAQGVYIYALRQLIALRRALHADVRALEADLQAKIAAAKKAFFDEKQGVFVSGKDRQISYASNVWMVLAGVLEPKQNKAVLDRLEGYGALPMVTPYMYHHYIEALLSVNEKEKAREVMNAYWGAMADDGASTFYELFDPKHPEDSPYGGKAVLSYCHAWSCTPSYFLRKYFEVK